MAARKFQVRNTETRAIEHVEAALLASKPRSFMKKYVLEDDAEAFDADYLAAKHGFRRSYFLEHTREPGVRKCFHVWHLVCIQHLKNDFAVPLSDYLDMTREVLDVYAANKRPSRATNPRTSVGYRKREMYLKRLRENTLK